MSYLTNQILRGAETIRRNSSESNKNTDSGFNKNMTTDTPRIDSGYSQPAPDCPLCQNNTMVWETTHGWKCNRAGCHTIISRNAADAKVERLKRPYGCKCQTLRERALGDGCDECNKALVIEMLTDERDELEAEVERLNGLLSDLLILTEKIYWNSNNYKMIKEAHRDCK